MSEMMMNRLPQPTWNRLRVNGVSVSCPDAFPAADAEFRLPEGSGILHTEADDTFADSGLCDALAQVNAGPCHVLTFPQNSHTEGSVLVRVPLNDGGFRLHLIAEKHSSGSVAVLLEGSAEATALARVTAEAEEDAQLHVSVCRLMKGQGTVLQDFCAHVGDNASVKLIQLELGGGTSFVGNRAELIGRRSAYEADMGYDLSGGRLDVNLVARHRGPHSTSRMDALGILGEGGVKCFRDTIDFVHGCHDAVGSETEDVLMLGDEVVNQSVPLILCDEENVDGTHGATIGRLDEDTLYYMASRGIDEEAARGMVARARMRAVCELIPCAEAREAAMACISSTEEPQHDD